MNKFNGICIFALLLCGSSISFADNSGCPPGQIAVLKGGGVNNYSDLVTQTNVDPKCSEALQVKHAGGLRCWPQGCTGAFTLKKYGNPSKKNQCAITQLEITVKSPTNIWYDISLVNGYGGPATMTAQGGQSISVNSAHNNDNKPGVYPLGCDICSSREAPPCNFRSTLGQYKGCNSAPCNMQTSSLPFTVSE